VKTNVNIVQEWKHLLPVAQPPQLFDEFEQLTGSKYALASLYTVNILLVHLQTVYSFHDRAVRQIGILLVQYFIRSLAFFFFTNLECLKFLASLSNSHKHCSYFVRALYTSHCQ